MADFAQRQFRSGNRDLLVGARGAVVGAECKTDEQHIKPEETEYRPGADRDKDDARDEAQDTEAKHQDQKTAGAERTVRGDDCGKDLRVDRRLPAAVIVGIHRTHYTKNPMAKNLTKNPAARKTTRQRIAAARKGKAARVKDAKARLAGDRKAAHGE